MDEKLLVEIYFTYGKSSGDELYDRFIINNSTMDRESIFECFSYDDAHGSWEDFVNGDSDYFSFDIYGGDWDDPTGGYVEVHTKDEMIDKIQREARMEIEKVEALFSK